MVATLTLLATIVFSVYLRGRGLLGMLPVLLGAARPAHILTPTATVRRIVNVAALLSVEAQQKLSMGA